MCITTLNFFAVALLIGLQMFIVSARVTSLPELHGTPFSQISKGKEKNCFDVNYWPMETIKKKAKLFRFRISEDTNLVSKNVELVDFRSYIYFFQDFSRFLHKMGMKVRTILVNANVKER